MQCTNVVLSLFYYIDWLKLLFPTNFRTVPPGLDVVHIYVRLHTVLLDGFDAIDPLYLLTSVAVCM